MGRWNNIEESPFNNATSVFEPMFWFPEVNISQVAIDIKDIAELPAKLRAIPAADIQRMQSSLAEAQPFFRYRCVHIAASIVPAELCAWQPRLQAAKVSQCQATVGSQAMEGGHSHLDNQGCAPLGQDHLVHSSTLARSNGLGCPLCRRKPEEAAHAGVVTASDVIMEEMCRQGRMAQASAAVEQPAQLPHKHGHAKQHIHGTARMALTRMLG